MNKLDVQNAILNAMTPYLDDDQLYQLKNTLIEQLYGMNIVEEETRLSVGKRTKICVKKNENLCQKFCAATLMSEIPAIKNGAVVLLDSTSRLAASTTPSILSIPATIDEYLDVLSEACGKINE